MGKAASLIQSSISRSGKWLGKPGVLGDILAECAQRFQCAFCTYVPERRRLKPFFEQKFGREWIYKAHAFQGSPITEIFAEYDRHLV